MPQERIERRIFVASSWGNVRQSQNLVDDLREHGHEVFAFHDPDNVPAGLEGFIFDAEDYQKRCLGDSYAPIRWKEFLTWIPTQRAYTYDIRALKWADTAILLIPAGPSAHLEAGLAAGWGKELIIHGEIPVGEYEVMYLLADRHYKWNERAYLLNYLRTEAVPT